MNLEIEALPQIRFTIYFHVTLLDFEYSGKQFLELL